MALEHQQVPSLKLRGNSSDSIDDGDDLKYTSLKDIMLNSPPKSPDGNEPFDYSTIVIRNELVKCAALAYLQSATILASENEGKNFLARFWTMLKKEVGLRASRKIYPVDLVNSCLPVDELLANMTNKRIHNHISD